MTSMAQISSPPSSRSRSSGASASRYTCMYNDPLPTHSHHITIIRLIDSDRDQISDAAAVYFVMPSRENIERICRDCQAQLYDNYYFNFITPIPRDALEQLAKVAVETNTVPQITKVRGGGCVCE